MSDFKHITVTPADEDDEVIVAGTARSQRAAESELEPAAVPAQAEAGEPSEHSATASASQAAPPSSASRAEAPRSRKPVPRKDDYHETTLADLEPNGMPLAQKIVIIAAVVCIIGALVYYFAVMR